MTAAAPWFLTLSIVLAVNTAIAAAYYLRIVAAMYFREPKNPGPATGGPGALLATWLCAVLVVVTGIRSGPLIAQANTSARAATQALAAGATEP